jgi:hypothetical protein
MWWEFAVNMPPTAQMLSSAWMQWEDENALQKPSRFRSKEVEQQDLFEAGTFRGNQQPPIPH